ncbi:unnamed protein product [Ilex paraguariensis]|uniref:Uncharacterized protein n=1 Tax=Ilex paraguariensis TaxID=185542 RepID=A0ABC8R438_9AQUA
METLAWEKWSSFTQNRYMEEVEKYSKPGSVAEKKAYFEAHYKRKAAKKAAVLLEQDHAAANDSSEPHVMDEFCNNSYVNPELAQSESCVAIDETKGEEVTNAQLVSSVDAVGCNVEGNDLETAQVEVAESVPEQLSIAENPVVVDLFNQQESNENLSNTMSTQEKKTPVKV